MCGKVFVVKKKFADPQKSPLMSFETKTLKQIFLHIFNFSFVLALKTVDAQMLFWLIFFKMY